MTAALQPPSPADPQIAQLQHELAALRGLPFLHDVPWATQSRVAFRQTVRTEVAREFLGDRAQLLARSALVMGLLAKPIDLAAALEEAHATQVAAYYEPRDKLFRVVEAATPVRGQAAPPPPAPMILAHELVHALQDQHFDLIAYDGGEQNAAALTEDERLARHFVVEGEATFLMMAREQGRGEGTARRLGLLQVAAVRMSLAVLAAADVIELASLVRAGDVDVSPSEREEMAALTKLPPLIVVPLIDPYMKGAHFVSEVWGHGGWPAVSRLFTRPPASTEQVLHPAQKFLRGAEPPVPIRLSRSPTVSWAVEPPALTDVRGELGWRIYFKTWGHRAPDAAAAGWGGDRYWVWRAGDRLVALTATRWDTEADARRFCTDVRATLRRRRPGARAVRVGGVGGLGTVAWRGRDGGISAAACHGHDVDLVDGATADELGPLLEAARLAERGGSPTGTSEARPD